MRPARLVVSTVTAVVALLSVLASCTVGTGSKQVLPATFFGMHVHRLSNSSGSATPWPAAPVGSLRLWDNGTTWAHLQPTPTTWDFASLDAQVDQARANGADVLLVLGQTPAWASARRAAVTAYGTGASAEPRDPSLWQQYVSTVARRYRGRIAAYEAWNEPIEAKYYSGTPEELSKLTTLAVGAVKQADPHALVVSAGPYPRPGNVWWRRYLANGAGAAVDVIGVHLYSRTPEQAVEGYATMHQALVDLHLDRKPVWDTETGFGHGLPPYSLADARGTVLRAYLLVAGQGIRRFYWYAWDDHSWVGLRLTGPDSRTLTVAGQAYRQTVAALQGAEVLNCGSSTTGLSQCDTRKRGEHSRWYWTPVGSARVTLPSGTTGLRHLGGAWRSAVRGQVISVTAEPIEVPLAS